MAKSKEIIVPRIDQESVTVTLVGTSELITHRFSEKQIQDIADKQGGGGKKKKGKRDPKAEYKASMYLTEKGKPGIPAIAVKAAMVGACTFIDGVTKVAARGAFFVLGDILPVNHVKPHMRTDVVRLSGPGRVADLRYRAGFPAGWEVKVEVLYNPSVISTEGIINLLENAGFSVGIGDWRPSSTKGGPHGRFRVKAEGE